ncbi:S-layer homology domain-containing protein [Phascolarctobacterium faecium]|nr:S-layer homology domain-containing protein [Phascolarctobacterium faecium]MDM8111835.1 S-layer homology domain-containing protein [Phascolarctobacterium faecium]
MKKSLVLAMAMALGVTASAYAANPFSDVPAGHWAYDAVNKLAAEGVVDGYPDGTYGGDKLMTRYEMAQIVAKAMAKGANVDKLAAEFADELDSLGVRVANLEKKADNVKITGQIRLSYRDNDNDQAGNSGRLRTRLFVNGTINEDWTYTGRFENNQYYHGEKAGEYSGKSGDDEIDLNWAYVSGRVGGVKVDAGRQNFKTHTGNVLDAEFDGAKLAYGEKVKLTGYVGKAADDVFDADALGSGDGLTSDDRLYIADLSAKIGVVDAYVSYYNVDNGFSQEIYNVGAALPVAKDLKLSAEWMYGTADEGDDGLDNNGWVAGLAYKGAKASKPGSWGVYANYYDMPAMTYLDNTNDGYNGVMNKWQLDGDGFEGYEVGANVALAKNIVAGVKYFDLEQREGSADEQAIWSEVVFTF